VRYLKDFVSMMLNIEDGGTAINLNTCLRPTASDDIPVIGSLKWYPNVFLNAGHSGRGTTLGLSTSKIICEMIMKGEIEAKKGF
jgi:glycine/D-amino acid oxidase-like deaminating enzyme